MEKIERGRTAEPRTPRVSFFMTMGLIGIFAVLTGFAKTFIIPSAAGTFKAPLIIHVHGAFAFSWIILFFIQAALMHYDNFHWHRTLGIAGIFIAIGIAVTMVPAGAYVVQRSLNKGLGEAAYSDIVGTATTAIIFLALVIFGIAYRRTPPVHKRLMLLATIVVLWPAWFRFRHYFPSVPRPEIWFALVLPYIFIIVAWIWDKYANGRLHPVLGWVGLLIIVEQTSEAITYDGPTWRSIARVIYGIVSP